MPLHFDLFLFKTKFVLKGFLLLATSQSEAILFYFVKLIFSLSLHILKTSND